MLELFHYLMRVGPPAFAESFGWSAKVLIIAKTDEGGHPHGSQPSSAQANSAAYDYLGS